MVQKRIVWTEEMDTILREARAAKLPWEQIGAILNIDRVICSRRAKELNLPTERSPAPSAIAVARRAMSRR